MEQRFPGDNFGKHFMLPYGGINRIRFEGYFSPAHIVHVQDP
jgi:hypothetical protein